MTEAVIDRMDFSSADGSALVVLLSWLMAKEFRVGDVVRLYGPNGMRHQNPVRVISVSVDSGTVRVSGADLPTSVARGDVLRKVTDHQEQPAPKPGDGCTIHSLVAVDMLNRAELGRERYGTYLQAGNGRDAMRDAYEEALELCAYLRQALRERDGK